MKDFTYHKVSEKEKEGIKKQAKKLLSSFAGKLQKIKTKEEHFISQINKQGLREEGNGWETDPEFRDLTFLNAPLVENEFIVAEKGGWK
jgi:Asp-tRNA(Asn)/Glu-tRNA(Gln) amidotransferase C subunit